MSYTFTLSARNSIISNKIYPPVILEENATYVMGLIDFMTFNTIPNIDKSNNKFYIGNYVVELPEGSYEITDIEKTLNKQLSEKDATKHTVSESNQHAFKPVIVGNITISKSLDEAVREKAILHLRANHNTFKCEIKSNLEIDFRQPNSVASILGFKPKKLSANKTHHSDYPISITKVNSICIECNLIQNSFNNNLPVHIIHMFYPNVPPGYKIVENPTNVIYLPINSRFINEIILKITDQDGNLVNFKQELITIRLHLKKLT